MTDKTTASSQPQQTAAVPGLDAWAKLMQDHMARMNALAGELSRVEGHGAEQARKAIDEGAKLMHHSLDYGLQLSAEWRKLALETSRKAMDLVRPQA